MSISFTVFTVMAGNMEETWPPLLKPSGKMAMEESNNYYSLRIGYPDTKLVLAIALGRLASCLAILSKLS
jgi:hypothetical protein